MTKKNNPGKPCCDCQPETWDAARPSAWINDGDWERSGNSWVTETDDAMLLLSERFSGHTMLAWVFPTPATPLETQWQLVFWYVDEDNFWAFRLGREDGSPGYYTYRWIKVVDGEETIIRELRTLELGGPQQRVVADFNGDYVVVQIHYYTGDFFQTFALSEAEGEEPETPWRAGIQAVDVDDESIRLTSLSRVCSVNFTECRQCTETTPPPQQFQVVVSGLTGTVGATWNGTYLVDSLHFEDASRVCQWYQTMPETLKLRLYVGANRAFQMWDDYGNLARFVSGVIGGDCGDTRDMSLAQAGGQVGGGTGHAEMSVP